VEAARLEALHLKRQLDDAARGHHDTGTLRRRHEEAAEARQLAEARAGALEAQAVALDAQVGQLQQVCAVSPSPPLP